ncbi:MAG: mechanosensitive ion channel [Candidatus Omnitrophica bacterium]|nr:mechanosensitive ion channel [Candidatus Omnitrophota bacterium]
MNHDRITKIIDFITENAVHYSFQMIGAVVILVAGWVLSRFAAKMTQNALRERKIDITIEKFIAQLARWAVLALAILLSLSSLGVQIAPLIAGLSVAGVGIGLALQGPLSNYASGVTLIFTKPFKVGDIIEAAGVQGEVRDISLPRTELIALDGSIIIVPNKHIIGEVIKNYSEYRQLEFNVGISYDADVDKAFKVIETILSNHPLIPNHQAIKVGIRDFGESAIHLQAFVWVVQSNYGEVKFSVNKAILDQFRQNGIVIAYPQRDVHIHRDI